MPFTRVVREPEGLCANPEGCADGSGHPGSPQRRVLTVQVEQLVVRAELGDPTIDDDGDPVGVVGGVQPVGDGDDRTTPRSCSTTTRRWQGSGWYRRPVPARGWFSS